MVLRILRRVAQAWVPEGPASTRAGRGQPKERRSSGLAGHANKLGKQFYQLIREAGSFRSLGEVHTDARLKLASDERKGASYGLFTIFIRHYMQSGLRRAACPGDPSELSMTSAEKLSR
jgi:hypothetical protein